jgi:putative nucleotidyltransferase with HDIG domain
MEAEEIFQKLDRITELPTLPVILSRLNTMLADPDTSISKLKRVIETDQAITSKLLKLVNSAFYGFRARISNIPHALALLGFNSVRNAIISITVFDAFSKRAGAEGWDARDFWKHSMSVAVISRFLAGKSRVAVPDDAFVAGLLHDIGKLIMAQYFREKFTRVVTLMQEQGRSFAQAEKADYPPFDHARIGGYIAEKWQFPKSLIEAIQYHHTMTKEAADVGLLLCVHLANRIAHGGADIDQKNGKLQAVSPESWQFIAAVLETTSEWFPALSVEIESTCCFFLE